MRNNIEKEITIKYHISNNSSSRNKVIIKGNNIEVFNDLVDDSNYFKFCGIVNQVYHIYIYGDKTYHATFIILNSYELPYIFIFNNNLITFYLYDKNYLNYKIEKGELNLWPNHIQ